MKPKIPTRERLKQEEPPNAEAAPTPQPAPNDSFQFGYDTDYYFPRKALSRPAELIEDIDLSPLLADIGLLSHGVIVELFISESGLIDSVLIETTGVNDDLAERIRTLVSAIKFRAGELNGRPVKARTRIELYVSDPFPGKLPESHPANQK